MPEKKISQKLKADMNEALKMWNSDNPQGAWQIGTNWSNVGNELFETFINKYLFPKINETSLINVALADRFSWLTKEVDVIAQFSEEYVFADIVPTTLDLSQDEILNLRRNYPKMMTKLYGQGNYMKYKFTLNNNDNRLNWSTIGDAMASIAGLYERIISSFNIDEERRKKATIIDYGLTQIKATQKVSSKDELVDAITESMLDMQDQTDLFNEADHASGDDGLRHTTASNLEDIVIITDNKTKNYLLNTIVANTFQIAGLDITNHIMSWVDLGGVYKTTEDITISDPVTVAKFSAMGSWDKVHGFGLFIPKGSVFTFDVSQLSEFVGKCEEVKPVSDNFALLFDVNGLRFKRNTKGMLKQPIYLQETDEWQHMLMYYTFKAVSPFFNKKMIYSDDKDVANNAYKK